MSQPVSVSRAFKRRDAFAYLTDEDRYLSEAAEPEFSFGFVGCGMMGLEHMRNTQLLGKARIAGLYDPAEQSVKHALEMLEKRGGGRPTVYHSLEEACNDPATDALIIATPNYTHLDVMRVATQSNKALFLEKPIATTVGDAHEVCRLASAYPNIVRIGLQYRHKAIYAEAIDEVFRRESIGAVHSINMLEHRFPFLDKVGQWNKFNAYTGGALVEKCCHYFDLINLFARGTAEQVYATGNQAVNFREFSYDNKRADGLDQAHVTVRYDNGVIGAFSLCMFVPGVKEELVVCGDAGRLHAAEQAQLGSENSNVVEVWVGENGVSRVSHPQYPPYIENAGHHGSTFFEHVDFIEDLQKGDYAGPTLADAFWSIVVGAAAQVSIEQQAAIDIVDVLPDTVEDFLQPEG